MGLNRISLYQIELERGNKELSQVARLFIIIFLLYSNKDVSYCFASQIVIYKISYHDSIRESVLSLINMYHNYNTVTVLEDYSSSL